MGNKASSMLQDDEIKQISEETGFSASHIEKLYSRFSHLDTSNCGALSKSDLLSIPELAINPLCDRLIQMFFADCNQDDDRINFRQFTRVLATFRPDNGHHGGRKKNPASQQQTNPPKGQVGVNNERSRRDLSSHRPAEGQTRTEVSSVSRLAGSSHRGQSLGKLYDSNRNRSTSQLNTTASFADSLTNKLMFVFKIYDADNDGKISFNDLRSILKMMVGNYIEDVQLDKIATRAFVEVDEDNDGFIEFSEFCKVFSGRDLDDKLRVKFLN